MGLPVGEGGGRRSMCEQAGILRNFSSFGCVALGLGSRTEPVMPEVSTPNSLANGSAFCRRMLGTIEKGCDCSDGNEDGKCARLEARGSIRR